MDLLEMINDVKDWKPFYWEETLVEKDSQRIWSYFKIGEVKPDLHLVSGFYIDHWVGKVRVWGLDMDSFAVVHLSAEFLHQNPQGWKTSDYNYIRGKAVSAWDCIPSDIALHSAPDDKTPLYQALAKIWPEDAEILGSNENRKKFVLPEGMPKIHTIIPADFIKSKNPSGYNISSPVTDDDNSD